jgi:DNA-binding transcriptional MerR regulator
VQRGELIVSQIRLYLDEDILERSLIKALRNAGIDVSTTAEANNLSCTDEEQLIWATAQGRVIYTFNVGDFCYLHKIYMEQGRNHSGIVMGKQSYSIGEQLRGFLKLISLKTAEEMICQQQFLVNYLDK